MSSSKNDITALDMSMIPSEKSQGECPLDVEFQFVNKTLEAICINHW